MSSKRKTGDQQKQGKRGAEAPRFSFQPKTPEEIEEIKKALAEKTTRQKQQDAIEQLRREKRLGVPNSNPPAKQRPDCHSEKIPEILVWISSLHRTQHESGDKTALSRFLGAVAKPLDVLYFPWVHHALEKLIQCISLGEDVSSECRGYLETFWACIIRRRDTTTSQHQPIINLEIYEALRETKELRRSGCKKSKYVVKAFKEHAWKAHIEQHPFGYSGAIDLREIGAESLSAAKLTKYSLDGIQLMKDCQAWYGLEDEPSFEELLKYIYDRRFVLTPNKGTVEIPLPTSFKTNATQPKLPGKYPLISARTPSRLRYKKRTPIRKDQKQNAR